MHNYTLVIPTKKLTDLKHQHPDLTEQGILEQLRTHASHLAQRQHLESGGKRGDYIYISVIVSDVLTAEDIVLGP